MAITSKEQSNWEETVHITLLHNTNKYLGTAAVSLPQYTSHYYTLGTTDKREVGM